MAIDVVRSASSLLGCSTVSEPWYNNYGSQHANICRIDVAESALVDFIRDVVMRMMPEISRAFLDTPIRPTDPSASQLPVGPASLIMPERLSGDPGWVRTTINFSEPMMLLFISESALALHADGLHIRELLRKESPQVVQAALTDAIEEIRPDLPGVILLAIHFDLATLTWELLCYHRSFPPVDPGSRIPRKPLLPERD